MLIYQNPLDRPTAPSVLAIGSFDGLHLGHQALFNELKSLSLLHQAPSLVYTFDLPTRVLLENCKFLYSLEEKLEILAGFGLDEVVIVPFTRDFANKTAEDFLQELKLLNPLVIVAGEDFRFGHNRQGKLEDLAQISSLISISTQTLDGVDIKTSKIRELIEQNKVEQASILLGRPYSARGLVVLGDQLGRTIGFPTANIVCPEGKLLPSGVFAIETILEGTKLFGMANIGHRPTINGLEKRFEVHLFDFNKDIYGAELKIDFKYFLRPEQKFAGLEQLKAQIEQDRLQAKQLLSIINHS